MKAHSLSPCAPAEERVHYIGSGKKTEISPRKPGQHSGQASVLVSAAALGGQEASRVSAATFQAELGRDLWGKAAWILCLLISIFSIVSFL